MDSSSACSVANSRIRLRWRKVLQVNNLGVSHEALDLFRL